MPADMRQVTLEPSSFELVTGTPPYFDPKAATVCSDPQRAYAQWELRGRNRGIRAGGLTSAGAEGAFRNLCLPLITIAPGEHSSRLASHLSGSETCCHAQGALPSLHSGWLSHTNGPPLPSLSHCYCERRMGQGPPSTSPSANGSGFLALCADLLERFGNPSHGAVDGSPHHRKLVAHLLLRVVFSACLAL